MPEYVNHGVLEGFRDTDFVAGTVSGLPYEVVNPSGDWKMYMPPGEWQGSSRGDSMSCVTFSALNSIEAQEQFLIGNQINYSDRWIAKMSDTTRDGNWLWKVADTIRKYGLVREGSYPAPLTYTWDEYHAPIPQDKMNELLAEGKKWLEEWEIAYEVVGPNKDDLMKHLKHAPIQITIPGHAIVDIYQEQDITRYFDSYNPYYKTTNVSNLRAALKIVLKKRKKETMRLVRDNGTVYLVGNKGKVGIATPETLALLNKVSDEIVDGDTSATPDLGVMDQGLIIDFKQGV